MLIVNVNSFSFVCHISLMSQGLALLRTRGIQVTSQEMSSSAQFLPPPSSSHYSSVRGAIHSYILYTTIFSKAFGREAVLKENTVGL